MEAGNLAGVDSILRHLRLFQQAVLTHQHILAGALDAEEIAHAGPEAILPGDEVIFNAGGKID